ncbi:MAG: 6-hydroxymethylpterin diphosphokinase MptE-like protein [Hydrogenovibrio sp.]|nr:6-hydroxymethylpterin diphosphokinase MptE-like protein [Hydrogenovibrio sp.]
METIDTQNLYTNAFGDHYFQEINQKAFDTVGATSTFNKVFNKTLDVDNMLFIIVGSDSGLLIPYLQKFHTGRGRQYIIMERPEIIEYIQKNIEIDEDVIDLQPMEMDFGELSDLYTDHVSHNRYMLLRSLAVIDGHSDLYTAHWEESLDRYNIFASSESGYAINNIFVDSQLRNLASNTTPLSSLGRSLEGMTSVIMGGGPSLDDSIDWIKENQNKLVIFAAARIANRLKKEGIQPDFFVSVDPHEVSYDNSKQILQFDDSAILVHSNNANSKLISEWNGLHAYLGLMFPWVDTTHEQPENLTTVGPTVTNTMASVAGYLGSKQIIFSGVDFCYGENGKSYESESVESKTGKYLDTATNRVKTYSGRIAETTPSFANARQGMEELVAYSNEFFGSQFYTLSPETALMENVEYSETDKITLPETDKTSSITQIKDTLSFDLSSYKDHLKYAKSYCQEMRDLCKEVVKEAKNGKKIAKMLFKNLDETDKLTQEIITTQQKTNQIMGEHAEFVFNYSIKAYKDFMDPSIKQDDMTRDDIKNSFIHYFSGVINSAIPLRKSIETAITRLNHRINETKGAKSFAKLVEKWREYNEEGRPRVWLKMNGLSLDDLTEEQQVEVNTLLEVFQEELHRTETKLSQQLKSQGDNIGALYERINRYFAEHRVYELEDLINHIAEKDLPYSDDLCHIGTGYLYELKEMPDAAVEHFIQIQDHKLLLEGLKRVLNISLKKKDYENALNTLEVLTHYSDDFFVAYADIVAAMGDGPSAVEIYFHYLQQHDDDTATWIKVAKLLIHLKIYEEAINAIQKIRELEPNNPVADELMNLATQPKN